MYTIFVLPLWNFCWCIHSLWTFIAEVTARITSKLRWISINCGWLSICVCLYYACPQWASIYVRRVSDVCMHSNAYLRTLQVCIPMCVTTAYLDTICCTVNFTYVWGTTVDVAWPYNIMFSMTFLSATSARALPAHLAPAGSWRCVPRKRTRYHTYWVCYFLNIMFASHWILRLPYYSNIEFYIEYYVTTLSSMFRTFAVFWI